MISLRAISVPVIVAIVLLALSRSALAIGSSGIGTFTFVLYGYNVNGDLTNGIITHEGDVQMQMSIDQTISITNGTVHITGNGVWNGNTNFSVFGGSISDVKGTVHACVLIACQTANFTGSGSWTGTLSWSKSAGSQGTGTFQVTLSVTGANITQTESLPVSGNWTATFAI